MYDFVAVDFETSNKRQDPCQVALVFVRNGEIAETYSSYINPHSRFDPYFSSIHGISDKDVLDAPDFPQVYEKLFRAFRHYPVVAHGAQFDKSVFCKACARYHLPVPKMTFYCTSMLYQENAPDLGCYKLNALTEHFGISLDQHHDALCDAVACAKLFVRLLGDEDSAIYPLTSSHGETNSRSSASVEFVFSCGDDEDAQPHQVEPNMIYDKLEESIAGKKIVITGDIEQATRAEIGRMITEAGGRVTSAVSSKTNYLAVGMLDASVVSDKVNHKSGKILSAESLRANGGLIKIVRLSELYQALMEKAK